MLHRRIDKALVTGVVALTLGLIGAPATLASTVTVTGDTLRVTETGDEENKILVHFDGGGNLYSVNDSESALTVAGTCAAVGDGHTAICPAAGIHTISVDSDARDDSITLDSTIPDTVTERLAGGSGNDGISGAGGPGTISGESGNDTISGHGTVDGGSGSDTVTGTAGAEDIRGGSGRDLLNGGPGPDDIDGGSGMDTLLYPDRATGISVTIGAANRNDGGIEDQGAGGRDTVHGGVETVIGTPENDVLAGDSSSETLVGAAGDDILVGNSGRDTLLGLEGNDQIFGGSGSDVLRGWLGGDREFGGPDGDRVSGGPGGDLIVGNFGSDILQGKGGTDFLKARDGTRDVKIKCGAGNNRAEGAKRDRHLDPRAKSC
jgi:Ca2+-binding RTX toxin-like protein